MSHILNFFAYSRGTNEPDRKDQQKCPNPRCRRTFMKAIERRSKLCCPWCHKELPEDFYE